MEKSGALNSSKLVHEGLPIINSMKLVSVSEAFCYDKRMRKLSKKRLVIIITSILIILASVYIAFLYFSPKAVNNSPADSAQYFIPGIVSFSLKPEYVGRQDTIDALAKSVNGKIKFCTSNKDVCDISVEVGKEVESEKYLETRLEVESSFLSLPMSLN